jgi:hypothetical protein
MSEVYQGGHRELQDRFDTRRLADRLEERIFHGTFSDSDREFIERQSMFFLATVDDEGRPNCSFKGGVPGFVRVVEDDTLAFPSYDGNGMFLSMGNVAATGEVGMLFVDFGSQSRIRVNGTASIDYDDPLIESFPEAQFVVRVQAREVFFNCPRYIPKMELVEPSVFSPTGEEPAPIPAWKRSEGMKDTLPADDPSRDLSRPTAP